MPYKGWSKPGEIRNFTPHPIKIVDSTGRVKRTLKSQGLARLSTKIVSAPSIDGVRIIYQRFGSLKGLPEPKPGIYLVVSQLIKNAPFLQYRDDLLVPTEIIRDKKGTVMGCQSLGK